MVLRPVARGQAVRRELPLPRRRAGRLDARPSSRPTSRSPASRSSSTRTSWREGHEFFSLGGVSVTPDGHLLAFSTDTEGDERYLLRVKDLRTGEMLPDEVPNTLGGATWDRNGTTLFYSTVDAAWRPDKIWRHVLGTPVADDVLVHHETDEKFWTGIGRTRSDRFLVRASGSKTTTEYAVLDADDPAGEFRVVAPRRQGVEYSVEHAVLKGEDVLLVVHNDGAENYTLAVTPVDATSHEDWRPLAPLRPGGAARGRRRVRDPPGASASAATG